MALPHTAGYIVHNCHVDCIVHTQEGVSTKYGVLFTASVPTALQPSSHHRIVSYETSSLAFGLSEAQDTEQAIRKQLDVNEAGSKLCGMLVKGDCFIVHSRDKQVCGCDNDDGDDDDDDDDDIDNDLSCSPLTGL
eukprot:scaffold218420_cov21-Tisochrysis_lutea.AAC.2